MLELVAAATAAILVLPDSREYATFTVDLWCVCAEDNSKSCALIFFYKIFRMTVYRRSINQLEFWARAPGSYCKFWIGFSARYRKKLCALSVIIPVWIAESDYRERHRVTYGLSGSRNESSVMRNTPIRL